MVAGYSLAFTDGPAKLTSPTSAVSSKVLLAGIGKDSLQGTIPELVFMAFQMTFAIITPALIIGSIVDRMKFSSLLIFMAIWLFVVYVPVCHWVWGGGFLGGDGVLDFAGGTVVHINAGIAGLVACLVLGRRTGYGTESMAPFNLVLTLIGASLLWVGWFGFNAGSAVAANGLPAWPWPRRRSPPPWRRSLGCSPSGSSTVSRACSASPPARLLASSPSLRLAASLIPRARWSSVRQPASAATSPRRA